MRVSQSQSRTKDQPPFVQTELSEKYGSCAPPKKMRACVCDQNISFHSPSSPLKYEGWLRLTNIL